jgi:antitoxin (DNA-binding transcriptional repressor) of toxin-antitoxin stability system
MKTIQAGELKKHFSEILKEIRNGEEFVISFGRKKEKIAVIIPYKNYQNKQERKLGILEGIASCHIHDDFEISEEEFL